MSFSESYKRGSAGCAQEAKKRLFSPEFEVEGKIRLSLGVAAMAFGISIKALERMSERGRYLSLRVEKKEAVIELKPEAEQKARDLWQGMLESLEKGRSSASAAFREYHEVAGRFQDSLNRQTISSDEADIFQMRLLVLWNLLPPAMQDQLRAEGISPDGV